MQAQEFLTMGIRRLLLLSVLLWSLSEAEVVRSVSDCTEFFLHGTPPQIPGVLEDGEIKDQNRYKPICQTYENRRRFFTLYDTTNKIPVFSAYKFIGEKTTIKSPDVGWIIEPQLEKSMVQSFHGFPSNDKISTFTMTNSVPWEATFSKGSWKKMDNCIKCVMKKYCINNNNRIEGFLVTGADPGLSLNNKINIPSAMWSAFWCYNSREQKWLARHWGRIVPDGPPGKYMETETLNQLKFRKTSPFVLFPGSQCPPDTTVTEFYPEFNDEKNCNCPPASTTTASPNTTTPITTTPLPSIETIETATTTLSKMTSLPTTTTTTTTTSSTTSSTNSTNSTTSNTTTTKTFTPTPPDNNSTDESSTDDSSTDDSSTDDSSTDDSSTDDSSTDDYYTDDYSPDCYTGDDNPPINKSPDDNSPVKTPEWIDSLIQEIKKLLCI